jgi:hypothetical protein
MTKMSLGSSLEIFIVVVSSHAIKYMSKYKKHMHQLIIISIRCDMMKLKCKCGNEWDYQGKKKVGSYAICPDCRKIVRISSLG